MEVMVMAIQRRLQQQPVQPNLFAASDVEHRVVTPIWQLLPEDARAAATKLIAQLLTDHQRAVLEDRRTGGRSDV
jgi:hypothetical protein